MKILKFSRFQLEQVRGARGLLTIKFLDNQGEAYSWAPKWNDAEQLFLKAINVESFNKPESEWLPRFSRTVRETAESVAQPIQDAAKLRGRFVSVSEGKLIFEMYEEYNSPPSVASVPALFPIDMHFLDTWLDVDVESLVINKVCVQIRSLNGRRRVYPDPSEDMA